MGGWGAAADEDGDDGAEVWVVPVTASSEDVFVVATRRAGRTLDGFTERKDRDGWKAEPGTETHRARSSSEFSMPTAAVSLIVADIPMNLFIYFLDASRDTASCGSVPTFHFFGGASFFISMVPEQYT